MDVDLKRDSEILPKKNFGSWKKFKIFNLMVWMWTKSEIFFWGQQENQ